MTSTSVTITLSVANDGTLLINGQRIPNTGPEQVEVSTKTPKSRNKISRETVRSIYTDYHRNKVSTRQLAARYNVGKSTVFEIVSREARRLDTQDLDR
jgi:transcriptional regulator of aromatic amino acid metabolism